MNELQPCGMCGAPWAQLCQDKDEHIAELEARITELEEKGRAFFNAVQRQQYANDPVLPWPTIAAYANAFNDLLEPEDD